jgi:kynurenine formamidase
VTKGIDDVVALAQRLSNWGRWGPDDEIGTINFITPETVARAREEIQTGVVHSLAIPFDSNGPQKGGFGRFNPIHLMLRDGGDALSGAFKQFYGGVDRHIRGTDDIIIMPLQCATQWDGLGHIIHGDRIYNGFSAAEVSSAGANRNGIEKARDRIVGRAVLLDVARALGEQWLAPGYGITSADVREGDIVLVRTGQMAEVAARGSWGDYAGGSAPGFALDSLEWIAHNRIAGVATDTWGAEVLPNETPDVFQPFHIVAIVYMGLLVGEIFDLEAFAADCAAEGRYSCFFAAPPLPITGAVGSPVNPVAVK